MENFEESTHLDVSYEEQIADIIKEYHGMNDIEDNIMEVKGIVEPEVGMVFDTVNEAYNYYNGYAREKGFSVRIFRTNKSKGKANPSKIIRQVLVCACEGEYRKIMTPKKKRENRRFDCKAMFEFKFVGDKYHVIKFISEHSHELVQPECKHYLKSQRKIEFSQVALINKMHSAGLKQSDIFSYLSQESGGTQHLNFIHYYCNNLIQKTRAEFLKKGDSQCLLDYFKKKKQENKHFFYSFRTNEDGEIRGIFFCDAKSRRDYGLFGDALCFDTTFKTNQYDMVCAPIVGINNHGQTTLFGCALLDGESTDAVVWLFTTFLDAMGGKKPVSIFTDQSIAISNAISAIFPECHHGLCLWHIYQNAAKHLAKVFASFKLFAPRLKACIYEAETIEEFEESWGKLLVDFELSDNNWLEGLYRLREKWAQVYSHAYFCAGMTTTQRSESINKFLKEYFQRSTVLREFVDQYDKAMANRREKERESENKTQQTSPNLVSGWSIEREAAKRYTRKMFYSFQKEFQQTIDLRLELEKDDGSIRTYKAIELASRRQCRTVVYNHLEQSVLCTCRKFEFVGILCSHALKVFRDLQYETLPPQYYLKRWCRSIADEEVFDIYGDLIPNDIDPSFTARYSQLSHICQRIVTKGAKYQEVSCLTEEVLLEVETKVNGWNDAMDKTRPATEKLSTNPQNTSYSNLVKELPLKDPKKKRCRGQAKRIKSSLEPEGSKKRSRNLKGDNAKDLPTKETAVGPSNVM